MPTKQAAPTADDATGVAIAALAYVAGDTVLLPRFLSITGIEASRIRHAAAEPGFLAGVLDFVLAHEPTLLAFSAEAGINPAGILAARRALPVGDDRHERSI